MDNHNMESTTDTNQPQPNIPPFNGQYSPPPTGPDFPQYDPQYTAPQYSDPQYYYQPPQDLPPENNSLGILCLILSIIGFLSGAFFVGLLLDVLAITLGTIALAKGTRKKRLPIIGIIISILSVMLTVAFFLLIGWVSFSDTPSSPVTSYEAPAVIDPAVLQENITFREYETPSGIVILCENANSQDVCIDTKIVYYDEDGKLLDTGDNYFPSCAANGTGSFVLRLPVSKNNYEPIPYKDYDIVHTVTQRSSYITPNYGSQIDIQTKINESGEVEAAFRNNSGVSFDDVEIMCVYWKDGSVVGYNTQYLWDLKKNHKSIETFYPPYDSQYKPLSYDNFEMYINSTLSYND